MGPVVPAVETSGRVGAGGWHCHAVSPFWKRPRGQNAVNHCLVSQGRDGGAGAEVLEVAWGFDSSRPVPMHTLAPVGSLAPLKTPLAEIMAVGTLLDIGGKRMGRQGLGWAEL